MQPGLNISETIPFYNMPASKFEQLCCDIVAHDKQVLTSEMYGRNGQKDYGVDIVALKKGSSEIIAIQAKCWKKCTKEKIIRANNEFVKFLDRWKAFNTTRFILCVACDISDVKAIDTFLQERIKFSEQNIEFEIWGGRTIQTKLCHYPQLATKFIDSNYWLDIILNRKSDHSTQISDFYTGTTKSILNTLEHSYFHEILTVFSSLTNCEAKCNLLEKLVATTDKISGRSQPSASQAIRIMKKLMEEDINLDTWEVRRAFGNTLGGITSELFSCESKNQSKSFMDFIEFCLEDNNKRILLAQSATSSFQSARNVGFKNILNLLNSKHPQIRWQLMKGWHFIGPIIKSKKALLSTLDISDTWIRRRLLNTIIVNSGRNINAYKSWRGTVKALLELETNLDIKDGYISALTFWVKRNTLIDIKPNRRGEELNHPNVINVSLSNFIEEGTEGTIMELVNSINLACISLDREILNLDKVSLARKLLLGNEGRYGIIKSWIETIVHNSSPPTLGIVIEKLMTCYDEGVRWAIAKLAKRWALNLGEQDRFKIFFRLVNDSHPWVLQETLKELGQYNFIRMGDNSRLLFTSAYNNMTRATEIGWDKKELMNAFIQVHSTQPDALDLTSFLK